MKTEKQNGFTLIELLIVVGIIVIMTSVVLVIFSPARRGEEYAAAMAKQIAVHIREIQNDALTGKVLDSNPNRVMCGYGIHRESASQYKLFFVYRDRNNEECRDFTDRTLSNPGTPSRVGEYATYDMQYAATMGAFSDVVYFAPHAEAYVGGALADTSVNNPMTISVSISSAPPQFVCVYPRGEVMENGTSAACP